MRLIQKDLSISGVGSNINLTLVTLNPLKFTSYTGLFKKIKEVVSENTWYTLFKLKYIILLMKRSYCEDGWSS
jgi:hypothetical protein